MSQTIENPFAVPARRRPSSMHIASRLLVASKGLAMVAALFAVLVIAQSKSRQWLLERWATGMAELPVAQQVERLLQINALGDIATSTVARRLAAKEDTVAAAAYELLREQQNRWTTRDDAAIGRAHANLVSGIAAVAPELSGQKARWAKELLDQSLMECVERRVREMDEAYDAANRVLALLVEANSTDSSIARASETQPVAPGVDSGETTIRPRLVPLPLKLQVLDEPAMAQSAAKVSLQAPEPALERLTPNKLETVQTEPKLTPVASPIELATTTNVETRDPLRTARYLTETSLEAFDTKSVIGLLGSNTAETRDQAVDELVRRGMSNEEIRIANQLASPVVEVRYGLLESIANRTDVDPRPWLLWLAEDPSREVRMRAISALATMNDTAVKQALQKRLSQEHDPAVLARLNVAVNVQAR